MIVKKSSEQDLSENLSPCKIEVKNLYKIFGENDQVMVEKVLAGMSKDDLLSEHQHVLGLSNVSFKIAQGEIFVFMGLSGSGKSTLIRHINRLIDPTAGEVWIDGKNILTFKPNNIQKLRQTKISMVFQKFALMPHMSVKQNVSYGLMVQKKDKKIIQSQSQYWIDKVGLSGFEEHMPSQLSGGMQQRVGLARALATDSEIILMDEAFSALDPLIRTEMQDLLLQLQKELKKTIMFITHDLEEAIKLGDHIAILKDGSIIQKGTPQDIILNPVDDYIRNFTENINILQSLNVSGVMREIKRPISLETARKKFDFIVPKDKRVRHVLRKMQDNTTAKCGVQSGDKIVGELDISDILKII